MIKNLLVFSFFPAFVPPKSGGEVRLFNFYFELSKFFNITLLTSGNLNAKLETIWHTNNFVEKRVPKDEVFVKQWQKLTPHAGEGDLSGPCVAESGKFLTELHKAYLESYSDSDIIIHEFPFTLYYDLFIELDDKPRIYNSHNCEYELYKKLHILSDSNKIPELVYDIETRLLKSVDLVTYCGLDDLAAFEKMLPIGLPKMVFIPNGMTQVGFSEIKEVGKNIRAVFIGSGHLPNVEAADFIVKILAPTNPEITFDIIGNCLVHDNFPSNVIRHGVVDAEIKSELISTANIAINPMLTGSGSSLKILDFVAHGTPVLSTPIGIRGFDFEDGKHCLLADIEKFSEVLQACATKTELLIQMGESAQEFAFNNYSWSAIAYKFRDLILTLKQSNNSFAIPTFVLSLNDYNPFHTVGGGATRLQGLYTATTDWSNVVVLCFSNDGAIGCVNVTNRIKCFHVPKTEKHLEEEAFFNSRFHISANDIVAFRNSSSNSVLVDVYTELRKYARIVVCEHPYMVSIPDKFGDRFVYSSQNFEYGLKKNLLEWHPDRKILLEDTFSAERLCIATSALVVAVSNEDAANFTQISDAVAPIIVVPNGAGNPKNPSMIDLVSVKDQIKLYSVVFLGSAHMPNVDAVKFIIEHLAPVCSSVDFHIIGSVCQALPASIPQNVVAWGQLEESKKSAVLQQCRVAINPMFSGSGSNVKLADFLANGLHVISTIFGVRGYPDVIKPHVTIANEESFAETIRNVLNDPSIGKNTKRRERHSLFVDYLSMSSLATRFVDSLKELEKPKKRMLFVTYRYTNPCFGGAEAYLLKLIEAVGQSGEFDVDVIVPKISSIKDFGRFSSQYDFDSEVCAPVGLKNIRFMRFPIIENHKKEINKKLVRAWRSQCELEKQLYISTKASIIDSGWGWGWGDPERCTDGIGRWGFTECGLHLVESAVVEIIGFTPTDAIIRICDSTGSELLHKEIKDEFQFEFIANAGAVEIYVSKDEEQLDDDSRCLAIYVKQILLNKRELDLTASSVSRNNGNEKAPVDTYLNLYRAACVSRDRHSISLTDIRGPHSPSLEDFLEHFTGQYDIVVTHNSVFRPAIAAISAANKANVPSILIPHAHLDDDYYHFSDVHQCALKASLVLAAPKAACQFYQCIGVQRVEYHSPGINISEIFSDQDVEEFQALYSRSEPFFLILGRKAGAKGYLDVIIEMENLKTRGVHLVLIGPDDDGIPVSSDNVTYLGLQSREVVRGAIRSCIGLINMSSSESFGMVLLEAWLAGKPVIVNTACSAFHDLAIHEVNALLVSKETLGEAMDRLATDRLLCDELGEAGRTIVNQYSWDTVCEDFLRESHMLINRRYKNHRN